MKKGGLFGKIIYYVFTFIIGIIIALGLPNYFYHFTASPKFIATSLNNGDYASAMVLVSNYFNRQMVYQSEFESGGGIVLFEAVNHFEKGADEETDRVEGTLYKSFVGFVYGTRETYNVYGTGGNRTKLLITTENGLDIDVDLLDYDADGDGTADGIATQTQNGFIIFEVSEQMLQPASASAYSSTISDMALIDRQGKEFWSAQGVNASFNSPFFGEFEEFIPQYNSLVEKYYVSTLNEEKTQINSELEQLFTNFGKSLGQKGDYAVISADSEDYLRVDRELSKATNKKAIPIIIVYFVCIYIIGDFLLGSHYIIKFFRWFLYKVCKIKPKNKQKLKKSEIFGHDYYSSVTVSLDLESVPDFNESVQIKYTNSDAEVVFILLKENNYTATERIKAGTYVNPFIDMNRVYAPTNLPDNLEVEGYKVDIKIKIIKREV